MKILKCFFCSLLVLGVCVVGIVEARQIGEFANFRITSSYAKTGYLTKSITKANYVINLQPSENLAPMTVKNRLVNSNNEARSSEAVTRCGQRDTIGNWGTAGYGYALQMKRQNWWDGAAAITGSWSPDDR
nr:hypothetical protein [Enterococcus cecorum]